MVDGMLRDELGRFVKGTPQHEESYHFPKGVYQGNGFKEGKKAWAKDRKFTKEHCENIGLSHIGQIPPNKGKKIEELYEEKEVKRIRTIIKQARAKQIFPIKDTLNLKNLNQLDNCNNGLC